jgi:ketosteroid isomerase-like protein
MKLINTLILAFLVSSASAATADAESDMWINSKIWELAFKTGDTDALARLYSEDAIVIPPSLEILNAPAKIKDYWNMQILNGFDNLRVQTINHRVDGDVIYQTAVWIATVTSNGVATDFDGEMTNVLSRQLDGSWKIQLQSWN